MERARQVRSSAGLPLGHLRGRLAETVAADYFFAAGFVLLAANLRAGPLELDLVLERGDLLVFVEVRSRRAGAIESALVSVRPKKRVQVRRAAAYAWRRSFQARTHLQRVRFDVVAVAFEGAGVAIEHIEAAF